MGTLLQDVRFGLRVLAKNPGFTAVAVLTLAIGIGANTAIFSIVNGLFLHPPGISHPGEMVAVRVKYDKYNLKSIVVSPPDFGQVRDRDGGRIFSSVAAMNDQSFNYAGNDLPQRLRGAEVTAQWFQVFDVKPLLGRVFLPEEDQPHANQVAVLAYSTWKGLFGGDPAIVGRTIELDQQPFKVVGVMGRDFAFPSQTQLWVPMGLAPTDYAPDNLFDERLFVVARIRRGVTRAQAEAYIQLVTRRIIQSDPRVAAYAKDSGWGLFAVPLMDFVYGDLRMPTLILFGAVGLVLLIACSNIAGLMLGRASARTKELAVRSALGASPWRLIRQALVESLLLAGIGSVLGLGLTEPAVRALLFLAPESVAKVIGIQTDIHVLLFTAAVGILSGVLFGSAPAWQTSRIRTFARLKEGGRSGTTTFARQRLRATLVVGQLALALVLLVGVGLLLKSLDRLEKVDPGFDPAGLMTGAVSLPDTRYAKPAMQTEFYRAATQQLASEPGVLSAAAAAPLPFTGFDPTASFNIESQPIGPGDPGPHGRVRWVSPEYFSVMKIPLVEGRFFTDQDREDTQPVIIIDENLARQYWPHQDPVGQHMRRGQRAPWATIVGVVKPVKHSGLVGDTGKGVYYYPLFQQPFSSAFFVARTTGHPAKLTSAIRDAMHSADPALPIYDLKSMADRVDGSLAPRRFAVTVLGFFAGVSLLMAMLGLYGILSFAVMQRTQEIGIRMALGAGRGEVLRMMIGRGMKLAGYGMTIGMFAGFACARLLSSQLFGVSALDLATFFWTAIILAVVAFVASYLPARQATKVDPMVALRNE